MKKIFFLLMFVFSFTGCMSTYRYDFSDTQDIYLDKNRKIAVSVSEDGYYGDDIYKGSGIFLSNCIRTEVSKYSSKALVLRKKVSLNDFSETELLQFDYIIIPEILHWEDRATAWSGLPDKVEIFIEIYDSRGALVKEGSFYGESAKATLMSNDPSDLLAKPIRNFFKSVFESEL